MKNKKFLKALGAECARLRQICGLTQQQVADMIGYSKENISAFENGRNGNVVIFNAYMGIADGYRDALEYIEREINEHDS